jgi:DNA modification methylase
MTTRKPRQRLPSKTGLERHLETVPIASLRRFADNARVHGEDQLKALEASIRQFGFVQPLLIERDGTIIGGHGRLLAAERAGLTEVPVLRLAHLTSEQARALRLADNRIAEMATWDPVLLAKELEFLESTDWDIGDLGFDSIPVLEDARASDGPAARKGNEPQPDEPETEAPEPPKRPVTRLGDVWLLGDHRVVCADSLLEVNHELITAGKRFDAVLTDPPYAIYGSATGVSSSVSDDKLVRPFFRSVLALAQSSTRAFAHIYVCCDWRSWASWWEVAKEVDLEAKNMLVWDKGGSGLGSNYANTHELIGFFCNQPKAKTMRSGGPTGQRQVHASNVMRFPRPSGKERLHNAAKPVPMLQQVIANATDEGDSVLDPFAGSGSTLMACEKSKRHCTTVECEPGYCDVVVRRWQEATGLVARHAATRDSFQEVSAARMGKNS